MTVQIKKFQTLSLDELYQILKLRVDVFVVEQNCVYPELDNLDQEAIHLFIQEKGQIAGYLRIYFQNNTRAAIGRVITHEKFRKMGVGRQLMDNAMEYLENDNKTTSVYLQAQDHLVEFYRSYGFKSNSDSYLDSGIPHVDMELTFG